MSKRNKTIEVEIVEGKNHGGEQIDLEVTVKRKPIGTITKQNDDKMITVTTSSGKERSVTDIDEAVQAVIADYNLYEL